MASPAVAGVAALVRSYYPKLTVSQVKAILLNSGLTTKSKVVVSGDASKSMDFQKISKSGKMVNAFNALILAERVSKGTVNL